MEPVKPPSGPTAPQVAARVTPLGRGWMLLALEAGAVLRNPATGIEMRLTGEDAEALRQGNVTPEALAQRAGAAVPYVPPAAVTVAFSPEALRLSGQMGAGQSGTGQTGTRAKGAVQTGAPDLPPAVRARLRALWIGAILLVLLALVLIGTG